MEVRERHTPSRMSTASEGALPGSLEDVLDTEAPVYRSPASATPHVRTSATIRPSPSVQRRRTDLWEGELESEDVGDGGYGSREALTKKEMMDQDPWSFPVRPVFPSGWRYMRCTTRNEVYWWWAHGTTCGVLVVGARHYMWCIGGGHTALHVVY